MSIKITQEKEKIIQNLESFSQKLYDIESKFSVDVSTLISKVNQAKENVKNDIFSIAFFGAFSDGKSTILSVLIDKLDIKISPEPTTDKIQPYTFKDYKIIDTPGLFSENLIHDELTKKYISEANIVIYTVDPVNPLKESHLQTVKWILSDLKKFESTIFVINKMDEVSDLEDDEDFRKNANIKKKVVHDIVHEVVNFNGELKIACVAADPHGEGLEFWKNNNTNYKKLSRIKSLELLISDFKKTYKNELIIKAGFSVIRDTSTQIISELNHIKTSLNSGVNLLSSQINEHNNRVQVLEKDIGRGYTNIKEDLIALREDVLMDVDTVSDMPQLNSILQKRLGKDNYFLQETINLIIRKHTENSLTESKKIFESLEESLNYHSNIQDKLLEKLLLSDTGKSVVNTMLNLPTKQIAAAVIKTKTFLKIPFNFQPWGAIKFAKFLQTIPIVMMVLQTALEIWSKIKLNEKKIEIKNALENAFKGFLQGLTTESYTKNYFPHVAEAKKILISVQDSKKEIEQTIKNIEPVIKDIKQMITNTDEIIGPLNVVNNLSQHSIAPKQQLTHAPALPPMRLIVKCKTTMATIYKKISTIFTNFLK